MLTYVLSDLHGCFSKLRALVTKCLIDADARPYRFIFLGDYVDRGPQAAAVIQYLIDWQSTAPQTIFLTGNHEELLLNALAGGTSATVWLSNGGDATLRSYGISSVRDMPEHHLAWLRALQLYHDDGLRYFVHAGVNPARPLNNQDPHDLLWIREPFISSAIDFGRLVVHGHTPLFDTPEEKHNRVNIDTGAAFGGPLIAAVFSDESRNAIRFIQQTE